MKAVIKASQERINLLVYRGSDYFWTTSRDGAIVFESKTALDADLHQYESAQWRTYCEVEVEHV
jgi:hypothetical protein